MWSIAARRGAGHDALFVVIAAHFAEEIRRGALRAGDRLPSTRALAAQLDLNRNTIIAAFDELAAQGWVVSRGAGGTFVSDELPERAVRRPASGPDRALAGRPGFEVRAVAPPRAIFGPDDIDYQLSAGVPDTRLLPAGLLARAYRRVLRSRAGRAALDYGDARGALRLREALAAMLRTTRGIPATADNIVITRGSQQALDLASRLLLAPGDTVAVEELGYRPAWRAFEESGALLAGVPLDGSGLVVDKLPAARAVYVTPHHQYPTAVLLSPARRIALLERARAERMAIIEDDYDHEFHFDGRPVAPLAANDPGGNVIYVGTLSKILAPGLRLGFIAAPPRVVESIAALHAIADRHGDQVLEHAVADLIDDGELQRHARKMRLAYEARRDALVKALRKQLSGVLSFEVPAGGITLWARVAPDVALDVWCERALGRGVALATGKDFALDGRARPFVRLAYARYSETELADAVRRMRDALPRGRTSPKVPA